MKRKPTKQKPLERVYSGDKSKAFWDRVNKIRDEEGKYAVGLAAYVAGCLLQDVEGRVLQIIREAEEPSHPW